MPGSNDQSKPGASFITNWVLYRTVSASDATPSAPYTALEALPSIDLSRNANGLTNQIWVVVERVSGTGTVTVDLWMKENGSIAAALKPHRKIPAITPLPGSGPGTTVTVVTTAVDTNPDPIKFTLLNAGIYRVLLTLTAASSWKVHTCHT